MIKIQYSLLKRITIYPIHNMAFGKYLSVSYIKKHKVEVAVVALGLGVVWYLHMRGAFFGGGGGGGAGGGGAGGGGQGGGGKGGGGNKGGNQGGGGVGNCVMILTNAGIGMDTAMTACMQLNMNQGNQGRQGGGGRGQGGGGKGGGGAGGGGAGGGGGHGGGGG
jgi:hypothetical protein